MLPKQITKKLPWEDDTASSDWGCTKDPHSHQGDLRGKPRESSAMLMRWRNPVLEDPTWLSDLPGRQLVHLASANLG